MDEVSINLLNLQGQPFFNGKLILREVANGNGAAAAGLATNSIFFCFLFVKTH